MGFERSLSYPISAVYIVEVETKLETKRKSTNSLTTYFLTQRRPSVVGILPGNWRIEFILAMILAQRQIFL